MVLWNAGHRLSGDFTFGKELCLEDPQTTSHFGRERAS